LSARNPVSPPIHSEISEKLSGGKGREKGEKKKLAANPEKWLLSFVPSQGRRRCIPSSQRRILGVREGEGGKKKKKITSPSYHSRHLDGRNGCGKKRKGEKKKKEKGTGC